MVVVPSQFCLGIGKNKSPAVRLLILNSFLTFQTSTYHISIQSSINSQTSSSFTHYRRTATQSTGKLPLSTQLAHAFPRPASAPDPLWTRMRNVSVTLYNLSMTLQRRVQSPVGSGPCLSYYHSSGVDLVHPFTAGADCERDLSHLRRILICPPCLDQEDRIQQIALHMPLGDHPPFFFSIGLLCGTLCLFIKAFLGHYGSLVQALLVVLILSIPFTKDWIPSIVSLQDRIAREAGRICNRL